MSETNVPVRSSVVENLEVRLGSNVDRRQNQVEVVHADHRNNEEEKKKLCYSHRQLYHMQLSLLEVTT